MVVMVVNNEDRILLALYSDSKKITKPLQSRLNQPRCWHVKEVCAESLLLKMADVGKSLQRRYTRATGHYCGTQEPLSAESKAPI